MNTYIQITASDNVAVALATLPRGFQIDVNGKQITLEEDIPSGHKVALTDLNTGDMVIKYGFPIGHTLHEIPAGHWVNEKNMSTNFPVLRIISIPPNSGSRSIKTSTAHSWAMHVKTGMWESAMKYGLFPPSDA